MTEKLARSSYARDDLYLALQQMLPVATEQEEYDDMKSMTEEYHRYKGQYVKHLNFNPDNENLSKCFIDLPT